MKFVLLKKRERHSKNVQSSIEMTERTTIKEEEEKVKTLTKWVSKMTEKQLQKSLTEMDDEDDMMMMTEKESSMKIKDIECLFSDRNLDFARTEAGSKGNKKAEKKERLCKTEVTPKRRVKLGDFLLKAISLPFKTSAMNDD